MTKCDLDFCDNNAYWDHGEFVLCKKHHRGIDWDAKKERGERQ